MIYVVATTQVKPEGTRCLHQGRTRHASPRRCKEKGCIAYEGHTSVNDPNLYVVVERWETRDDLNAHRQGAAHEGLARIFDAAARHRRR